MIETRPFEVEMFHGGITDHYIDGEPHRYRYAKNFQVTDNGKLFTRPGSRIYDDTAYLIPAGNQRIGSLLDLDNELLVQSSRNLYYINGTYQTLTGPSGNPVISAGTTANYVSWSTWNKHLYVTSDAFPSPMKIYKDGANNLQVRNCGLPALASAPSITPTAGANTYLYAFVHYYEYAVGTRTFQDFGPRTIVEVLSSADPGSGAASVSSIPVLANGSTENYDTSNIKIKIYRTVTGGTDFYYVGEVTNGTTTYSDTLSDALLQDNVLLYTTDGTLDQEPAPLAKYMHVTNNFGYYAYIKSSTEEQSNRVIQSFAYNPDSVNSSFFVDVDEDIIGLSSYNFTPIVFCDNSIYRIDGNYNDDGTGGMFIQKISDTAGCVSNRSIIKTRKGTFFAGKDGFYWTDGYQVTRISTQFEKRYADFIINEPDKIYAAYDRKEDRIFWAVQEDGSNGENDTLYVFDLQYGIREDGVFTTWENGSYFAPSALLYFDGKLLRADKRGYVFKFDSNTYSDPRIDTTVTPSNWVTKEIIYDYTSCAYKFGTSFIRKWIPRIVVTCANSTNLSLQIVSINDTGRKIASLKPIYFKNAMVWGDDDVVWGDPDLIWNYDGVIEEQRRMPAKSLRCSYKQIQLTNAYIDIDSSVETGTATVVNATNIVTLDDGTKVWPSKSIGYFISFSSDNYATEYEVTARTATTLTLQDTQNTLPNGSYSWRLKGYAKDQIVDILSYCIHFSLLGKTQPTANTGGV